MPRLCRKQRFGESAQRQSWEDSGGQGSIGGTVIISGSAPNNKRAAKFATKCSTHVNQKCPGERHASAYRYVGDPDHFIMHASTFAYLAHTGGVQSRMIVKVGPFCRKGLSPQGEPPWVAHPLHVAARPSFRLRLVAGRGVAAKSCSASRTYRNRRLHPYRWADAAPLAKSSARR